MSTENLLHLGDAARDALALPSEKRIEMIRAGTFVELPALKSILTDLRRLLADVRPLRPDNLLIIGEPHSGKSSLLKRFQDVNTPGIDPSHEFSTRPILKIECPDGCDRTDLYMRILNELNAEYNPRSRAPALRSQVVRLFKVLGVKVLIIEEIHDCMSGTIRQQDDLYAALKKLGNETKVSIVAAGIRKASAIFTRDDQMTSRFKPVYVPLLAKPQAVGTLLASLEMRLPLRVASNMKGRAFVKSVMKRAGDRVGDITDLICDLAVQAIESGEERISAEGLKKYEWEPTTNRRKFAEQIRVDTGLMDQAS